jgi:PAS domain S-box-containing protein
MTILASAIGLALALTLGYFVARSIAKPIGELRTAALRIGDGDLSARVACASSDEIGMLARTFNQMAERLAATTVSIGNLNEVIDSMAGALFLLGPDGKIVSANPAASQLLCYEPAELIGTPFYTVCPEFGAQLTRVADGGPVASGEHRFHRQDGTIVPVSFSASALRGDHGGVRGYACLAQDLTGRRQLEEDLRRSLSEKELLLREVHHRVKNNLQVISSLLELQSRSVSDPHALAKFQDSQDRIRSMVLIHEQLYRSLNLESIHMRSYLELLATNLSQSHVDRFERIDMRVDVDDICLPLDQALTCGLIVNELVTNAFKHAFPSNSAGAIRVALQQSSSGAVVLEVSDNGRGFARTPVQDVSTTLGFTLVEALVKQLQGRLAIDGTGGAAFRVEFSGASLAMVG